MHKLKKQFKYKVYSRKPDPGGKNLLKRYHDLEEGLEKLFGINIFSQRNSRIIASFDQKDYYHSIDCENDLGPGETLKGHFGKPNYGLEISYSLIDFGKKGYWETRHPREFLYYRYQIRFEGIETNYDVGGHLELPLETWDKEIALKIFNNLMKVKKDDIPECCRYAGMYHWEWGQTIDAKGNLTDYESGWG